MKTLLIVCSCHHKSTLKVAREIEKVLGAVIKTPQETTPEELREYDLIGLGSGIYDYRHHKLLLELADSLSAVSDRRAFLFSTSGVTRPAAKFHKPLRDKLLSRGYEIIGEFNCKGFNTNSFLKYIGGMNKGRPNDNDMANARLFARKLLSQ